MVTPLAIGDARETDEANARLIAEAPAMLSALRSILWLVDHGQLVEPEPSHVGPLHIGEARALLAKIDAH